MTAADLSSAANAIRNRDRVRAPMRWLLRRRVAAELRSAGFEQPDRDVSDEHGNDEVERGIGCASQADPEGRP